MGTAAMVQEAGSSAQTGTRRLSTVAVVPAFNEAPAISTVVGEALALRRAGLALFERVIVVDNDSDDDTGVIARRTGAEVVCEARRGYGAACLAGIAAAGDAEVIVFVDGDASVDLAQTADLLDALEAGADLVIGARHDAPPGSMSTAQRFGNELAAFLIRLMWRHPTTDLGPFRAISRAALDRLEMCDAHFGWTVEMQVKAIQRGLRVVEVPVRLRPRIGVSKISGTLRGVIGAGTGILGTIARLWWRERRRPLPVPVARVPRAARPVVSPPPEESCR